jgi:O-antigen/teichoic acid export membrane protein
MTVEKAASAGAWSALDLGLRQGLHFAVSIVLARLLAPEDFGIIGVLGFFTSLAVVFVNGGLTMALVQRQQSSREEESAVFWANLAASILFGLLLIAVAPLVARFYEQPLIQPLMAVAAAQIVFSALGAVQGAMLTRDLRFDQLTKTGLVASLSSGAVGVAAALAGWGAWALAAQLLTMAAAGTAALWWVTGWRPALTFRFQSLRNVAGFGARVGISSTLEVIYAHGFNLLIARIYGFRDLGMWTRAAGVNILPVSIISQVIGRTAFPLFAARASDLDGLRRGLKMSIGICTFLSLPLMVGLCLLSDLVIHTLFGPKWADAGPLLAVFTLGGMLMPLQVINLQLLLAVGDSKTFLRIEIWKKVLGIAIIGPACFVSLFAIAWTAVTFSVVAFFVNAWPMRKLLQFGPIDQLWHLWRVVAAAALMAVGVMALKAALTLPAPLELLILTAAGGAIYVATSAALREPAFSEALQLSRGLWAKFANRRGRTHVSPVPEQPD